MLTLRPFTIRFPRGSPSSLYLCPECITTNNLNLFKRACQSQTKTGGIWPTKRSQDLLIMSFWCTCGIHGPWKFAQNVQTIDEHRTRGHIRPGNHGGFSWPEKLRKIAKVSRKQFSGLNKLQRVIKGSTSRLPRSHHLHQGSWICSISIEFWTWEVHIYRTDNGSWCRKQWKCHDSTLSHGLCQGIWFLQITLSVSLDVKK